MKLKSLVIAAAAATALIAGAAHATVTTSPVSLTGQSFTDALLGTMQVTGPSDTLGLVFAADNTSFPPPLSGHFSLQAVAYTGVPAGPLADLDATGAGFSFKNVATGDDQLKPSGTLSGPAALPGFDAVRESSEGSDVPVPETYAVMLAGLVAVGFMSSRRRQD